MSDASARPASRGDLRGRAKAIGVCTGVFFVAAGLLMMAWPLISATWIVPVIIGIGLLSGGAFALVQFGRTGGSAFGALMFIVLGLFAIVFPNQTATVMVTFAGLFLILIGALGVAFGAVASGRWRYISLVIGSCLILGGVFAIVVPDIALVIVSVLGGLFILTVGLTTIVMSRRIRPVTQQTVIVIDAP